MQTLVKMGLLIIITASLATASWGRSLLRKRQQRRFHRGLIKQVTVQLKAKGVTFLWRAPNGKRVIHYRGVKVPQGLLARLKRYVKQGHKTLAVGGRYAFIGGRLGTVKPRFAYRIKRRWRGVRVVKLNGVMPLFSVSILPNQAGQKRRVYQLRGIVDSRLNRRDNRLICLYGTWFDFADHSRSMVSQSNGIKGRSLFFFANEYRHPRSWRQIPDARARRLAYQAAQRRKAKGLPPKARKLKVPILPLKRLKGYQNICKRRLSRIEKRFAMAPLPRTTARPAPPRKR